MSRYCDSCGTKLPGSKGHGFLTRKGGLVCGRTKISKSVRKQDGTLYFDEDAPAPRECRG